MTTRLGAERPTACGIIGPVVTRPFAVPDGRTRQDQATFRSGSPSTARGSLAHERWKWRPAAVVCLPQPATTRDGDVAFVLNATRGRDSIRGIVMEHECDFHLTKSEMNI